MADIFDYMSILCVDEREKVQRWKCKRCGKVTFTIISDYTEYPDPGKCKRSTKKILPPHNWVKDGQFSKSEFEEMRANAQAEWNERKARWEAEERAEMEAKKARERAEMEAKKASEAARKRKEARDRVVGIIKFIMIIIAIYALWKMFQAYPIH
ncbi:MAG: hypothetical protein II847_00255 [Ruminobacter sp.]|uniref:hypothetical protein n=1 Tax=Ruminobacter sp. TaxID=2774296 RepID=UPI00257EBF2E|nr:hypothetical protein [Ruminobacter sp.]MBQ3774548.1 hypothetical protein [Ruminobacter sp.]